MKIVLIFCFTCLFYLTTSAQDFPSEIFHEGKLILESGDTLKGAIKYDLEQNLIQLKYKGKIHATSAGEMLYFEIFDKKQEKYRQFYVVPYGANSNYKSPHFFELLYQGDLSLLAREYVRSENVGSNWGYYGSYTRAVLDYSLYFFSKDAQQIIPFNKKKGDLLTIMSKRSGEIKKFMKEHRLKADDIADVVQITIEYNKLIQK